MSESNTLRRLPFGGISANALKLFAMACMLLDHMWATVISGNLWMNCVGRLAFPIFAFQLVEGALHTSDRRKYALRLLIFALVSEIPFNFVIGGSWLFPFYQNVMWTLLLGLWAVTSIEDARKDPANNSIARAVLVTFVSLVLGAVCMTDYGMHGVLTVLVFYFFRNFRGAWLCQLGALIIINAYMLKGQTIPIGSFELPIQAFAVLALIPICLYNGRKGKGGKVMQYIGYAFYPVHLAVLAALSFIL